MTTTDRYILAPRAILGDATLRDMREYMLKLRRVDTGCPALVLTETGEIEWAWVGARREAGA